ncbi:hypothetical protein HOY80DRAFT_1098131 [Tuber brumale]|nr:hypothetical protein HOY80DRAFT_1098131 [Tuber brumale]
MDSTFAILSTADACFRTGQNLFERYQETRGVNRDLDGLGIRIENVWIDIASRLETVQSSPKAVPGNLSVRMENLLHQLLYLVHTSSKNHEQTTDKTRGTTTKKIKFSLFQKRLLGKDATALQKWRDKFDSTFPTLSIPQSPEPKTFR